MAEFIPKRRKLIYPREEEEEGISENRHLGAAATRLRTRPSKLFDSCSYEIVFCLDEPKKGKWDNDGNAWAHSKLYTIKIGPGKVYPNPLAPFWSGEIPATGRLAALGSYIYCLGGKRNYMKWWSGSSDVCKLRINPVAKEWVRENPMICQRYCPEPWLLGGKLYISNSIHHKLSSHWGEVFDPANGKWEHIHDPPNYPPQNGEQIVSATLQNQDRMFFILAHRVIGNNHSAIFYAYNVHKRCWGMLAPPKRNLHPLFLDGGGGDQWLEGAVGVNNTLYWVRRPRDTTLKKDDLLFLAYDLKLDLWLEGHLKVFGCPDTRPGFFHLAKQKFCIFQCANHDVRSLIVEILHMSEEKNLSISVICDQQYTLEPTILRNKVHPKLVYCNVRKPETEQFKSPSSLKLQTEKPSIKGKKAN